LQKINPFMLIADRIQATHQLPHGDVPSAAIPVTPNPSNGKELS
jgi:hypothetical protein